MRDSGLDNTKVFASDMLAGKLALVSGAGRGIGLAVAHALASCGARLVLLGRDHERLSESARAIAEVDALYSVDFADAASTENVIETIRERHQVDLLINNAGVYFTAALPEQTLSSWQRLFDVNLTAAMLLMRAFLPGMESRGGGGAVVNISSISGKHAEAFGSAYSASKAALQALTQAAALEYARSGVTVNAVCPGWVATDMAREQIESPQWQSLNGLPADSAAEYTRLSVPQERFIEPDEVASLVTFLCGPGARGITGQAINVCGGLSLQ